MAGLITTTQARIASLQAANSAILSQVQAASQAGETAATNSTIAAYEARLAEIGALQLELASLTAERDALLPLVQADAAAEAGALSDIETAWSSLAEKIGAGIKLSRGSAERAGRYRELTGVFTYGRTQTDPNEDSEAFGNIERSIQSTLAETASEIVRTRFMVPAQVL